MDLSRMKKHTGMLNNTGVRCVVVYREVPGDESFCLVVETERLPDMYHDNVMECVNSAEAQKTNDFYEVLNRRTFADGLNGLQALHFKGYLRKLPVSQITLLPFPGQELPLALLNAQLSGQAEAYAAEEKAKAKADAQQKRIDDPMGDPTDPVQQAQQLLVQAELLVAEAELKRNRAFELDPSLKPKKTAKAKAETVDEADDTKTRGRPKLSEEEKAIRAEERKVKRRERDRANAAKKKAEKAAAEKKAAVDEKIMRDANRADG